MNEIFLRDDHSLYFGKGILCALAFSVVVHLLLLRVIEQIFSHCTSLTTMRAKQTKNNTKPEKRIHSVLSPAVSGVVTAKCTAFNFPTTDHIRIEWLTDN